MSSIPEGFVERTYRVEPEAFGVLEWQGEVTDPFSVPIEDPFRDPFQEEPGSLTLTNVFSQYGARFPAGSSAELDTNKNQIVVINSPKNHKRFKAVMEKMEKLNNPPTGIEIEARFQDFPAPSAP